MTAIAQVTKKAESTIFLAILLISLAYWFGIPSVPFHPDESTQIFMSADFDLAFTNPSVLFWSPEPVDPLRQNYRMLDAPLTRYLIGAGRTVTIQAATPADWDWSKTWQENNANGALPAPVLLIFSRFSVAFLFPLTLLFTYLTGRSLQGKTFGVWMVVLLAANPLVLLHTRRAMAESVLLCSTSLFLWLIARKKANPVGLSLSTALAFCAKQSTLILAPFGFVAVLLNSTRRTDFKKASLTLLVFGIIFVLTFILLNPFLWAQPVPAANAAIQARQQLFANQVAAFQAQMPNLVIESPTDRLLALVGNLFLTPPAFYEIGNYVNETRLSEQIYLSNPINNILHDLAGGGLLLLFCLVGFSVATWKNIFRRPISPQVMLLAGLTVAQAIAILVAFPFPFQRYVMPLIPFTTLWTAFGFYYLWYSLRERVSNKKAG